MASVGKGGSGGLLSSHYPVNRDAITFSMSFRGFLVSKPSYWKGREHVYLYLREFYGLDLTVIHNNSIHTPLDKLKYMANANFIGGWEMWSRVCPERRGNGYLEGLITFMCYLT